MALRQCAVQSSLLARSCGENCAEPLRPGEAVAARRGVSSSAPRRGASACVVVPQHLRWLRLQLPREERRQAPPDAASLGQAKAGPRGLERPAGFTEISPYATLPASVRRETRLPVSPPSSHCTTALKRFAACAPRIYSAPTPRRPSTMPAPMTAHGVRASVPHDAWVAG